MNISRYFPSLSALVLGYFSTNRATVHDKPFKIRRCRVSGSRLREEERTFKLLNRGSIQLGEPQKMGERVVPLRGLKLRLGAKPRQAMKLTPDPNAASRISIEEKVTIR